MRLRKPRTAAYAFTLTFVLGLALYALTNWRTEVRAQQQPQEKLKTLVQHEPGDVPALAEQTAVPAKQFIRYAPLKGFGGYINADTESVTLRESPQKSSRVVAKVKTDSYRRAEILDSTSDFLRVHFTTDADSDADNEARDYEGWASWKEVSPYVTAIVLDTATGEVVSRMALPNENDESNSSYSVAFSPDGAHAVFYSPWSRDACEVETGDYRPRRSLLMSDSLQLESMFYGPTDGELYAVARASEHLRLDKNASLNLLRVSTEETEEPSRELYDAASGFVVSRDGRTGIMTHQSESGASTSILDVFDLETMMIRNTLKLESASPVTYAGMVVINRDGSKLYTTESDAEGQQIISVFETRTGKRLRDLKLGNMEPGWEGLTPDSIVGDTVFSRVWNQEQENPSPRGMWVDAKGPVTAAHGIAYAIEAGDARFGVNEQGTQLFRLDEKNRIREMLTIDRPELKHQPDMMDGLGIYNIIASPDGKRLIIIIGSIDTC